MTSSAHPRQHQRVAGHRRESLGRELGVWLRDLVVQLVDEPAMLTIVPRWEDDDALVLVVRAARGGDVGQLVGRRGATIDGVRAVARAVGMRCGVRLHVEVVEG